MSVYISQKVVWFWSAGGSTVCIYVPTTQTLNVSEALQEWWEMSAELLGGLGQSTVPPECYGNTVLHWGIWQEELGHEQILELPDNQGCLASVYCGGKPLEVLVTFFLVITKNDRCAFYTQNLLNQRTFHVCHVQ